MDDDEASVGRLGCADLVVIDPCNCVKKFEEIVMQKDCCASCKRAGKV